MEILGYAASIIMGLSLGLIGGGGSILTVPILVYLFGVGPVESTAYSLFVVGLTSLAGTFTHFKNNNVHLKTAFIFGVPSILSVYAVRCEWNRAYWSGAHACRHQDPPEAAGASRPAGQARGLWFC